jgi:hypothetical protein
MAIGTTAIKETGKLAAITTRIPIQSVNLAEYSKIASVGISPSTFAIAAFHYISNCHTYLLRELTAEESGEHTGKNFVNHIHIFCEEVQNAELRQYHQ